MKHSAHILFSILASLGMPLLAVTPMSDDNRSAAA